MDLFRIGNFTASHLQPYIIAEIGVNHEGCLDLAKQLIKQAKQGGAQAAKFQSYKAERLASKSSPAYWDTTKESIKSQYQLFKKYDSFTREDYEQLASYCNELNIDFMSTPFDLSAVEFLSPLVPAFKIASADITNVPLLRAVSKTGHPLILSTGASSLPEISFAVDICKQAGAKTIALLHCVLNYPTLTENANLRNILQLKRCFPELAIGYSDHVVPDEAISALEMATMIGALVLEKHFTHDKTLPGNDHYHAMDEKDLRNFVRKLCIYRSLAGSQSRSTDNEAAARLYARRSIVAARSIKKGERFTEENLTTKRPALGVSPVHWSNVVGKHALTNISEDSLLKWSVIKESIETND